MAYTTNMYLWMQP